MSLKNGVWGGSVRRAIPAEVGYTFCVCQFEADASNVNNAIKLAARNLRCSSFMLEYRERALTARTEKNIFVFPSECERIGTHGYRGCCDCGGVYPAFFHQMGYSDDRNIHLPNGRVYSMVNWVDTNPGNPWEESGCLFYGGKSVLIKDFQWNNSNQKPNAVRIERNMGKIRLCAEGGYDTRFWEFPISELGMIRKMLPGVPFFESRKGAPLYIRDRVMDLE